MKGQRYLGGDCQHICGDLQQRVGAEASKSPPPTLLPHRSPSPKPAEPSLTRTLSLPRRRPTHVASASSTAE